MDLSFLSQQVIEIAETTGEYISAEAEGISLNKADYKGKNDLVTHVDKESEKQIVNALNKIFPDADIIAEEGKYPSKGSNYKWIIDPLDGTTNFVHGIPAYTISIALLENDEPVIGIVYDVARKECFSAYKGGGTSLNGKRVNVSINSSLDQCLMATGFPVTVFDKVDNMLSIIKSFIEKTHGVRRIGSAALDLAFVSCGRFEGFFEYNLNAWDVAAGALLVKEAGGIVTDFSGEENYIFGKEIIAGNAAHKDMIEIISKDWK